MICAAGGFSPISALAVIEPGEDILLPIRHNHRERIPGCFRCDLSADET